MNIYSLEKPERPIFDIMGNEIIRGHLVGFSKGGRGQRDLKIGVITAIRKRNSNKYPHALNLVTGSGWWSSEHQIKDGFNQSIIILNNPLFSLNSERINRLFEAIEEVRGRKHNDKIEYAGWNGQKYYRTVQWSSVIPNDYVFGEPIDKEQFCSIPDNKIIGKLKRQMEAAERKARFAAHKKSK